MKRIISFAFALLPLLSLMSCNNYHEKEFYSNKNNFIEASGCISSVEYGEKTNAIFITFENLVPEFADNLFSITSDSGELLKSRGIKEKLQVGKSVEFVSSVAYFGDGYVMPIVALSIDGEELLAFEEGYHNFIKKYQ